jgi:hypothetical protein
VENVLGVIGIFIFIVCVISLAAAITWLVVKLSPARSAAAKSEG